MSFTSYGLGQIPQPLRVLVLVYGTGTLRIPTSKDFEAKGMWLYFVFTSITYVCTPKLDSLVLFTDWCFYFWGR